VGLIETALREVGAARSIVVDEDGVILAGNATVEAAAAAGIERVQIIDADGETIIAVRRSGLTAEQKTRLALFDNRTSELADWDAGQLAALADETDLSALFRDDELAAIIAALPDDDDWATSMAGIPDGDKSPFEQMSFTLNADQAAQVRDAIALARKEGAFVDTGNDNGNGNALARICETYVTTGGHRG